MANKSMLCKDCGSDKVIMRYYKGEAEPQQFTITLCGQCLQLRSQLAIAKEEKLPFLKLIARIQKETFDRVHKEIVQSSVQDMLSQSRYKGENEYVSQYNSIATYWHKQFAKGETDA